MIEKIIIKRKQDENNFIFSSKAKKTIELTLAKYPINQKNSAVMPLLDIAMRECNGWLPNNAIKHVSDILEMPFIKVYEVASFYSMYNLKPVGKNFIQICSTTPCWLRGSDEVAEACYKKLQIKKGETTEDGMFTVKEVECLGACVNAPMVQINDDYYEDLDSKSMLKIINNIIDGTKNKIGPQVDRKCSEPRSGLTSLLKEEKNAQ